MKKGWFRKYIESLGVDVLKWKDLPTTFRSLVEEEMLTGKKKMWSFLVNHAEETVFLSFIAKVDDLLPETRIHVADGYWQDRTFSMFFQNGSKVVLT